ncbi:hypothetical protein NQ318_017748 [Aromia moschata]|uniref:Potassium channel domain-containing protein n=1 Tax=Aromia moschata TaxID=1265417 RepID=A0AAV8Y7M7_9CUCU|nr:hypothetical protein NQ318_017748 [Aromia moschata]
MIAYGDRARTQCEVVRLFRETHTDLTPLNQGTISKIEAQHREMGHVRKVPSKRQAVVDDDTKLNLLLALEENPITPARQLARDRDIQGGPTDVRNRHVQATLGVRRHAAGFHGRLDGHRHAHHPALSNYEIDDEFNLPITVALFILISYIFVGALIYCMWEGWNFFASFYFVFISMSTIGFGDYVPKHPICMIVSIVYLVFGLALMSMCINVVQEKLSDTFKRASAKLGASIGFQVEEDGSVVTVPPEAVEMPAVHDGGVIDADGIKPTLNNIAEKQKQS